MEIAPSQLLRQMISLSLSIDFPAFDETRTSHLFPRSRKCREPSEPAALAYNAASGVGLILNGCKI